MESFADLSHHNTAVDLAAYAAAGHTRVALKATEGTGFTDPVFASRWAAAGRLGLRRGAYHFARTSTSGEAQADYLLRAVDTAGGLSPGDWLVLDLEDNSSPSALASADGFAREFCGRMVARGHPVGLVYTGRWYAAPAGITPAILPPGWRRLWLSDYGTVDDQMMRLPAGWARDQVAARQFDHAATVLGITGPADYSRVLNDWLTPQTTPDRDEDDMVKLYRDPDGEVFAGAPGVWYRVPTDEYETVLAGAGGLGTPATVNARQRDVLRSAYLAMCPAPALDPEAFAAALAPHLPEVTAAQLVDALGAAHLVATTTVSVEPTR